MVIPVQPAATWIMETITICKKDATSMKTLIKSWMLIAAAAMAFTACTKDSVEEDNTLKPVQLTIQAGNPEVSGIDEQGTRTEMQGATPMWSANDQIGVTTTASAEASANHQSFTNDNESSTQTTTFSGSITIPAEGATLYAYYPYSNNGLGTGNKVFGALVDLPINQNPTATSFDGTADLLVSKPVQVTSTTTSIENMQFKRVSGVLKVVLLDNTTGDAITGQHVNTLSVATDESQTLHLAGRVVLDFVNGAMTAPYYNHSRSVVAHYTSATQYAIDGTNATYLNVYPQTLPTGTQLTVAASTEGYTINKVITLGQDIEILPGKITTLRIGIADEHITAAETGMALPFTDDFSWISTTSTTALRLTDYPKGTSGEELYTATEYTYPEAPALKFGSSKNRGYFTTADLDLSQPFTVIVHAKTWNSDVSSLQITAGESVQSQDLTADYAYYKFEFEPQGNKAKVEVRVTGKRGYVDYFQVTSGHDVALPPVLTITSAVNVSADPAGEQITVDYSIENPVEGETIAATATSGDAPATWIHDFDTTTDGQVTFMVDANNGDFRSATVTFTYATAPAQTITVSQLSSTPIEGGYVEVMTTEEVTAGEYILIGEFSGVSYYLPNTNAGSTAPTSTTLPSSTILTGNIITNPTTDMTWKFTAVDGGFTITSTADPTIGMGTKDTNNGLLVNSNSATSIWTITKTSNSWGWSICNTNSPKQPRYLATYATDNWRTYKTDVASNNKGSFRLFKKQ